MGSLLRAMMAGGGTPSLWTPAAVSLQSWLKCSDPAARTIVDNKFSNLSDKSGSGGGFVQIASSARPGLVSPGLNGLDTADFDGSNLYMSVGSNVIGRNVNALAIAILLRPDAVNADRRILNLSTGDSPTNARILIGFNASSQWRVGGRRTDGGSYAENTAVSASPVVGNWTILVACFNYGSANLAIRINGTEESSGSFLDAGMTSDTNSQGGTIGSGTNGLAFFLDGGLGEVVIQPSLADVEKIEGYLAHEWGIEAVLPIGHPYKDAPPTA